MLTLFEYLRKRACESIVAGVQDAVESLDRPAPIDKGNISPHDHLRVATKAPNEPNKVARTNGAIEFDPEKFLTGPATPSEGSSGEGELPPPRRQNNSRHTS